MPDSSNHTAIGMRRFLRLVVYAMLFASAGAVFVLGDRLWAAARVGSLPIWAPLLPPLMFTVFLVLYATDRFLEVRRRQARFGRAFFAVAFGIVFLTLLWPGQATHFQEIKKAKVQVSEAATLLRHREASVRAAACELLSWRGELDAYGSVEALAREDSVPDVRRACEGALLRLRAASQVGGGE